MWKIITTFWVLNCEFYVIKRAENEELDRTATGCFSFIVRSTNKENFTRLYEETVVSILNSC